MAFETHARQTQESARWREIFHRNNSRQEYRVFKLSADPKIPISRELSRWKEDKEGEKGEERKRVGVKIVRGKEGREGGKGKERKERKGRDRE